MLSKPRFLTAGEATLREMKKPQPEHMPDAKRQRRYRWMVRFATIANWMSATSKAALEIYERRVVGHRAAMRLQSEGVSIRSDTTMRRARVILAEETVKFRSERGYEPMTFNYTLAIQNDPWVDYPEIAALSETVEDERFD